MNEAGRMILQKAMSKKGDKGTQMNWLNFMVKKIWPHAHEAVKLAVVEDLQPKIQAALPSVFGTVIFKHFDLGSQCPEIREVAVAHGTQNQYDGLELDVKIVWDLISSNIVFEIQGIEIGIEEIRLDGTVRLQLRPLLEHLPTIGLAFSTRFRWQRAGKSMKINENHRFFYDFLSCLEANGAKRRAF